MPESYSNIVIHIVFSTKNRQPIIPERVEPDLYEFIKNTCRMKRCFPLAVGGKSDHIHIACQLSRSMTVSKLVQSIKHSSTKCLKLTHGIDMFTWQRGYGVFSVSYNGQQTIVNYIENQKAHHKKSSYRDEVINLFYKHGIDFQEADLEILPES